jgi:hypothetical protein
MQRCEAITLFCEAEKVLQTTNMCRVLSIVFNGTKNNLVLQYKHELPNKKIIGITFANRYGEAEFVFDHGLHWLQHPISSGMV